MRFVRGCAFLIVLAASLIDPTTPLAQQASPNEERLAPWAPVYPVGDALSRARAGPDQTGVFNRETIAVGGDARRYRMIVPGNYAPERPIGVLFGFQEAGPPDVGFLWKTGFEDFAQQAYWITVSMAVKAPGPWDAGNFEEDLNLDLRFFQKTLERLRGLYSIDEDRIHATGHSSGADFVQALAFVYPTMFAAINLNMSTTALNPREGALCACIVAGGLHDEQYGSIEHNRMLHDYYKARKMEMCCYEFHAGHHWPEPDESVFPPRQWTETVADFFLKHPRRFDPGNDVARSRQATFRDDFGAHPAALDGHRWKKEQFNSDGILRKLRVCDLKPEAGKLHGRLCNTGRHGVLYLTDTVATPAIWKVSFTVRSMGEDMELYPIVLRGLAGPVAFMKIGPEAWAWEMTDTHLEFRTRPDASVRALAKAPLDLRPDEQYRFILEHGAELAWAIHDSDDALVAEGVLTDAGDLIHEPEYGFGLRGKGAHVDFHSVELSQPDASVLDPLMENLLVDYFKAFSPF